MKGINNSFIRINLRIILVAVLLLVAMLGFLYYLAQHRLQQSMERLVKKEMDNISLSIKDKLSRIEVTMDNMAWVVGSELAEQDEMFRISEHIVENNPSMLGAGIAFVPGYYDSDGELFEPYAVRRDTDEIVTLQVEESGADYTGKEFFRIPLESGNSHWSTPYLDPDGAEAIITTYGVPVRDDSGIIAGVVFCDISLDWLDNVINHDKIYQSTRRLLVTGDGTLISGSEGYELEEVLRYLHSDKDNTGYTAVKDESGRKHHLFYDSVEGNTDWILVTICSDDEIFGRLRQVRTHMLLLVFFGMLILIFIVWRTSDYLERLRIVNAEQERISGELKVASEIQQSMLPPRQYSKDGIEIGASLVPAREVGGDVFDYYVRDDRLLFCIGDVSGKGAASAMLMSVVHSLFRAYSAHEDDPAAIMQAINDACCSENSSNMFVTFFIGILDIPNGELAYCNAGHDRPLVIGKEISSIEAPPHLPLGVFDYIKYKSGKCTLEAGSTLLLYTDGLTEAKNKERAQFGLSRVKESLEDTSGCSADEILRILDRKLGAFVGDNPQSDDLTLMAIRYKADNN